MYSGIERANICIRGLRTYGNPAPGNEMGQLLGEALTLRAIYYADLVKAGVMWWPGSNLFHRRRCIFQSQAAMSFTSS